MREVNIAPEFEADRRYSQTELGAMADELLREDARSELCRDCGERGEKTDLVVEVVQVATDDEGNHLVLRFPQFECGNGHAWYQGEGAVRGIGGDNPILFEEHFQSRRRREIYNCVSADTESLSKDRGWIRGEELGEGDLILIFDSATGQTRWGPALQVHRYAHRGELVRLHGQSLDALVTENHRWPVYCVNKQREFVGYQTFTTQQLPLSHNNKALLLGAPYEHPTESAYDDAFVRLQAWNLTEGHVWGRDTGLRTAITQSHIRHPDNVAAIRRDIERVGASFRPQKQGGNGSSGGFARREGLWCRETTIPSGATQFVLSGHALDPFLAIGRNRLRAPQPDFYSSLTAFQQAEFNRILMLGDGLQGGTVFSQYDSERMGSASSAFTLGGYSTSRTKCGNHMVVGGWDGRRGGKKWLQRLHVTPQPYHGDIWCPTTATGFWVARRNGKTFITGNSLGSPDPSIVSGIYNRAHPQGRKINSAEARKKHGASWYR